MHFLKLSASLKRTQNVQADLRLKKYICTHCCCIFFMDVFSRCSCSTSFFIYCIQSTILTSEIGSCALQIIFVATLSILPWRTVWVTLLFVSSTELQFFDNVGASKHLVLSGTTVRVAVCYEHCTLLNCLLAAVQSWMGLLLRSFTTKCGLLQFRMIVSPVCAGLNNLHFLRSSGHSLYASIFVFRVKCINIAKQQVICMLCSVIDLSLVLLCLCCILRFIVAVVSITLENKLHHST